VTLKAAAQAEPGWPEKTAKMGILNKECAYQRYDATPRIETLYQSETGLACWGSGFTMCPCLRSGWWGLFGVVWPEASRHQVRIGHSSRPVSSTSG
jgi:hypothetical protein